MGVKSPANVQVTTITTGFGPYQLTTTTPAATGYRAIADAVADGSLANGDLVSYVIEQNAAPTGKMFERGWGTINTTTLVLTPTLVKERSASLTSGGGWGAGTKDVFFAPPGADDVALLDQANTFTQNQKVEKTNPAILLAQAGVNRASLNYTGTDLWIQYFNSSSVLRGQLLIGENNVWQHLNTSGVADGQLTVGAGVLNFSPDGGVTTYKVVRFLGGGVVKQPFYVATAPLGWTKDTSQNDKALRVVSGLTGGTAGGSRALSSAVVGGTSLSTSHLTSHIHAIPHGTAIVDSFMPSSPVTVVTTLGSGASSANTSAEGGSSAHDHALALAYIDVIIASLD